MIINHFKMRADIDSYHLGGMGCSAGVIAIGLAQKLLRVGRRAGSRDSCSCLSVWMS